MKTRSGNYYQRQLIFEGNSLSANDNNSVTGGFVHYIPSSVRSNLNGANLLAYSSLAVAGRRQSNNGGSYSCINQDVSVNVTPRLKKNDIIVLWEGVNDIHGNSLTGAQGFANVVTYINTVMPYEPKLIICTTIAAVISGDSGLWTRQQDYNTLVRNNAATYGYTVCDLASDTHFDSEADTSDTTYYKSDTLHQATAGQAIVITMMTASVTAVL